MLPGVSKDAVLLILLAKLSQIAMLYRLNSVREDSASLVNFYGINLMPSGTGKDWTIDEIDDHYMASYRAKKLQLEEHYREREKSRLETFMDNVKESDMPRHLVDLFQDATLEGFLTMRKEFERAGFGGTLIQISEFSDYILNESTSRQQLLSIIKDVYESGNNNAKVIKMERTAESVRGVPNSILFQSTPTELLTGNGAKKMLSFLNKGLARRSLFCFSEQRNKVVIEKDFSKYMAGKKAIKEQLKETKKIIDRMVNINPSKPNFVFTLGAEQTMHEYMIACVQNNGTNVEEGIAAEKTSRPRKAQKLAGLIALIEHPVHRFIEASDVESAISVVEHYATYLEKFMSKIDEDPIFKLSNYFKNNLYKKLTKTDIRQQKFVSRGYFTKWINEAIDELQPLLVLQGYELEIQNVGAIGQQYMLKKINEVQPII